MATLKDLVENLRERDAEMRRMTDKIAQQYHDMKAPSDEAIAALESLRAFSDPEVEMTHITPHRPELHIVKAIADLRHDMTEGLARVESELAQIRRRVRLED